MILHWTKLFFFFSFPLLTAPLHSENTEVAAPDTPTENGYTINYNTVSIIEYIKFASKICNANFIYNAADLNFTVSVVSDAPITPDNVMATLIQVLRINGMQLLEQDNNLVIHKSDGVKQIATLITEGRSEGKAPIVTRIFRVKSVPVESIAAIVRPMISTAALLETSVESRVMILTDITANVDKVADLIDILDSPHAPLEIKSYEIQNNSPDFLIDMANQLMVPIAKGDPFILVPQPLANSIFIVSTPELINRANAILTSLDTPPKKTVLNQRKLKSENVFVYKAIHRPGDELLKALNAIAGNLATSGIPEGDLVDTIETARYIPETNSIAFFGSIESINKIKEFLTSLDISVGPTVEAGKPSFFVYKPQHRPAEELDKAILEMAHNLKGAAGADAALIDTIESVKVNASTNTLSFSGDEKTFPRVKELLALMDTPLPTVAAPPPPPTIPVSNQFFIYKPKHQKGDQLVLTLKEVTENLKTDHFADPAFLQTLQSMKWMKGNNAILFTGDAASIKKVEGLIGSLDVAGGSKVALEKTFLLYHLEYAPRDKAEKYLKQVGDNLSKQNEEDLVNTIQSMKWIEPAHSFLFQGNAQSVTRVKELLTNFDVPTEKPLAKQTAGYAIYKLQHISGDVIEKDLDTLAKNLQSSGMKDGGLLDVIENARYVKETNSILLTGDPEAIEEVKKIIAEYDYPRPATEGYAIYKLQHASGDVIAKDLDALAKNFQSSGIKEGGVLEVIKSARYVKETNSFLLTGDPEAVEKVKKIIAEYDYSRPATEGYAIYKLQHTSGDVIEEDLDALAKNFQSSGVKEGGVLEVIENARYVKETNSFLLTGDPEAIEEAKKIIAEYDYPRPTPQGNTHFFMYKPQYVPGDRIEKSLRDVSANLQKADLADPALLTTIRSMKYVDTTNSLLFTGTPDALGKVQLLLKDIDIPAQKHAPIQHVGKTTFLLYKLKVASGPQVVSSIKAMTADLKKSGTSDKEFIAALQSVKFIKETNSLLFTGSEEALTKVEPFVENFDVTSLAEPKVEKGPPSILAPSAPAVPAGPGNFLVYKPVSVPGPELEKMLIDFAENLQSSGLIDPNLFQAIRSMRWVEKTQSMIFTGEPKALEQIKQLLTDVDIPSNLPARAPSVSPLEPSISAIDNTSFLVYKLQFHKGDEIQGALRQIAKDLTLTNAPINQNLLNSINSIQWLDVTNSLLCTGDQETLVRLKELIKNLDVPLKQVYIEILVIETNLTNALQFGLEWGGKYKYRNKFQGTINNTVPTPNSSTACTNDTFMNTLNNLVPTNPPSALTSQMPFGCGFDLGVIGQVLKHNGQTFLTLGSLLEAVQQDSETAIILAPKIITQDGHTSSLFVGSNIPFVGSFVNNQGQTTVQTSNLEYRDIGLNLTLTPVLGNSDIVTLDISLDRTEATTDVTGAAINFNTQSAQGIITSRTTMQTTVHVPDKNFLILSGFVNNSNVKTKTGLPCLGGLPLIGAAFSEDNDTVNNQNIVIFLRPHIINSVDDMRQVTGEEEDVFRDQQATPFLLQQFKEGMELIKSVDDE